MLKLKLCRSRLCFIIASQLDTFTAICFAKKKHAVK